MARSFKEIKKHYNFTVEDERRLLSLKTLMEENASRAMDALHTWMLQTKEISEFFEDEERKKHIFTVQRNWFLDLFRGKYDNLYYEELIKIGRIHVRDRVDAHYMNRSINIIRNFCINLLDSKIEDSEERIRILISIEKILDINLDIITCSYIEEGFKKHSPQYKVSSFLIEFTENFSKTLNFILIVALVGLSFSVIISFWGDVKMIVKGDLQEGIISALGSILFLWVILELINTEIVHLKGGKFYISIFIGVALVAIIRETLIATLKH
ncbi:MAG: protoglobin domain-containing protein [Thermodesulfovibrionales bacterium]|nr:protoglobin domain-containing protein [Thermodesulfovibrionales bacterium]